MECDLSLSHNINASFFENHSKHGDGGGTDQLVQNASLGKNANKAAFRNDSAKLKQDMRLVMNRILCKEEIHFHPLMVLAFHDLPRKKSDQLSSLLGAVVK